MKKLLYNRQRTKIFNLDQVVCIERLEKGECKAIKLHFADKSKFIVAPNNEYIWPFVHDKETNTIIYDNIEANPKLWQYFEHKFTRSSLCQKCNGTSEQI